MIVYTKRFLFFKKSSCVSFISFFSICISSFKYLPQFIQSFYSLLSLSYFHSSIPSFISVQFHLYIFFHSFFSWLLFLSFSFFLYMFIVFSPFGIQIRAACSCLNLSLSQSGLISHFHYLTLRWSLFTNYMQKKQKLYYYG